MLPEAATCSHILMMPRIFLFIVDLILYMLLDIGFLMVKLKKDKKGKLKNFQLGICSIFVILAMIMACFNLNEIYSSIMILSSMMMVISTPFQEMERNYE